jgi:hypothetical protein
VIALQERAPGCSLSRIGPICLRVCVLKTTALKGGMWNVNPSLPDSETAHDWPQPSGARATGQVHSADTVDALGMQAFRYFHSAHRS